MGLLTPSIPNIAIAICSFLLSVAALYIYRAFFDSLSHIPGPKLAAASLWYEFYYDVIKRGRYTWEIGRMHEKYGPIVRINPYEVHIHDPEFIDQVYPGSSVRRTEKYAWAMSMFNIRYGFFATIDHDLHRLKRNNFAPYLSKASLHRLEPRMQSVMDHMVRKLRELQGTGKVFNLLDLYASLTGEVIGQYAFDRSYGLLDGPDFSPHWHQVMMDVSMNGHLMKHFSFLIPMMQAMPIWLVKLIAPGTLTLINFQTMFRNQVIQAKAEIAQGGADKPSGQINIFYDVLTNPDARLQEKDDDYLQDEAQAIVGAGTVTTAHILALLHFYILDTPGVRSRLQAELADLAASQPKPTWSQLEQLPYLSAVITEGLRIGYGVSGRVQRRFPDTVLQYGKYAIPTHTPISMTSVLVHDDPSLFPEPRSFKPERFLEQPQLRRYLIPFSRGSRQCVGLNLAYAEFYLGLAAVWWPGRFEWKLYETDRSDVETVHDFLNTSPRLDSLGIRAMVE
ncbi:MAG: hypothetical protein LQ345_005028 [Seirophora villosa]|nr:MAG: hypothetical protein LQ345_005028 [Seirophora villosa]